MGDGNVFVTLSNGNAVITGSNFGVQYFDITRSAYMHAICVRAVSRSRNDEAMSCQVGAANYVHVKSRAIERSKPENFRIGHFAEFNALHETKQLYIQFNIFKG